MQDLDDCSDMADTLYAQKERYRSLNKDLKEQVKVLEEQKTVLNAQVVDETKLKESYQAEVGRKSRRQKFWKGSTIVLGVVSVLESGWIAIKKVTD